LIYHDTWRLNKGNQVTQTALEGVVVETGKNPTATVIWLHGLGADGNDFVPIVSELDLTGCGVVRFVFPHAPTMPVTINGGYVMRAWYDILGTDLVRREDEAGIKNSAKAIEHIIANQRQAGIAASRIVLAGFSQGCAMSLYAGLRHSEPLGGLVALSGYLPIADKTAIERHSANYATPIFMAHGSADPVVPMHRATASRDVLQGMGYRVDWHSYAMQHSVCPQEISDVGEFFRRVLAA
jgi:phospholipase/carboxylesterase